MYLDHQPVSLMVTVAPLPTDGLPEFRNQNHRDDDQGSDN
ncbi:hypothetical protein SAMN04488513_10583 [Pseudozobellia thermophila]|uniref:Uncharacterized protein n=1 Tax=Pseudozobellia thermophila TaxID=192903 RepID=A0A1M6JMY0_9FLAO|nr:hypothetical protein SAMN04488513_10583 [Pseudozobellia thermophila]